MSKNEKNGRRITVSGRTVIVQGLKTVRCKEKATDLMPRRTGLRAMAAGELPKWPTPATLTGL
jgi:hypothetical protein